MQSGMVEGVQLPTQRWTILGPVPLLLVMQGKSCREVRVPVDSPNLRPNYFAIQPRSRCLSEWGCNMLGYIQGQEGFREKGVNWIHKRMCKARRPGQTEKGTRESVHGLKPKGFPSTSLPAPAQLFYRKRTKAECDVEMITGPLPLPSLPSNDQYHAGIVKK